MLWAAATLCFFRFFRAGEITIPYATAYSRGAHLSWGDISVDNRDTPTLLRVILKRSKTDQFGRGAEVYIGRTVCSLCPVAAVLSYMCSRGTSPGPFFTFKDGRPLTKPLFTKYVRTVLQEIGLPYQYFAGHSFRIRCCHGCYESEY